MRIALLVSSISNFGKNGLYNSQEIGLAKQIVRQGHDVTVYKLMSKDTEKNDDSKIMSNLSVKYFSVKSFGINGVVPLNMLDTNFDGMLFFSDTQFAVPKVYKWCKKNNIKFIPYIGVIESHSSNKLIRYVMNIFFFRNLNVYKKSNCLVKNEDVLQLLLKKRVKRVQLAPVGIDLDLLNKDYDIASVSNLKKKWNYHKDDKIILYIGRLESEKRPFDMIHLFKRIYDIDSSYKLIIVGKGFLKEKMLLEIKKLKINEVVNYIEQIENFNIWELYRLCDVFVNLNKNEIFGMVLLEAMYYECKVVAWEAPGPNYIIENEISGYLVSNSEEFIKCVTKDELGLGLGRRAHKRIEDELSWSKTASMIIDTIKSPK